MRLPSGNRAGGLGQDTGPLGLGPSLSNLGRFSAPVGTGREAAKKTTQNERLGAFFWARTERRVSDTLVFTDPWVQ